MPRSDSNRCSPHAAVLAADAWVKQHGVCDEGAMLLVAAFWAKLHSDLAHHMHEARAWLDEPDFDAWVRLCGGKPETVRERLLDDYWRVCA